MESENGAKRIPAALPPSVWALGCVSLFMDMSSELIHSLLPLFLVGTLGLSAAGLGLIEGIAEATASVVKVFSGTLSDRFRRRKPLVVAGYALAAITKPMFPLAGSAAEIIGARFLDRIGKGIRGAPRDALMADFVTKDQRGAAFGLRQSLDTIGAIAGPLLGLGAMVWFADDVRSALWVGAIPAVLAVIVLVIWVREPAHHHRTEQEPKAPPRLADAARLGRAFWIVAGIGGVMTLARFSEAFLILRAEDCGLPLRYAPLVLALMSVVYALSAYPAGLLSDRRGRGPLLVIGFCLLIAADVALALATDWMLLAAGVVLWGLHMGLTQGLLAALVADTAPSDLRGTGFGFFHLISGLALLLASLLAGLLWDRFGPAATFWAGAGFTALALVGLLPFLRRRTS